MVMLIGVIMISVVILPLFWKVTVYDTFLFGIGTSLFMPLYIIPMTSRILDLIGQTGGERAGEGRVYRASRNWLTMGRIIGLSSYLIVLPQNHSPVAITWLLFAVGVVPIAGWWFMRPFLVQQASESYKIRNQNE